MLNYNHLFYFYHIADLQSVSRASEKLNVGQPALSSQLKQLEEYFGEPLFLRQNRKMVLTDAGKVAYGYAQDIFGLGVELEEVMSGKPYSHRPHIRLGSLSSIPKHILTQAIEFVRSRHDCQFTVVEEKGEELLNQLFSHKIDLFISNHNPAPDKLIYSKRLARLPIFLFGAPSMKAYKENFPKSLSGASLILPTKDSKLYHDVEHFLEQKKIKFDTAAVCQDTSVQKILATHGVGLTPQPVVAVTELVQDKKLIDLGQLKGVYEEFFLISTQKRTEVPLVESIMSEFSLETY